MNNSDVPQRQHLVTLLFLAIALASIYYFSNPNSSSPYDYTYRIAKAFLIGELGERETPPSWITEMVPVGEYWYSVFPLGSVLSVFPFAVIGNLGFYSAVPSKAIVGLLAFGITALAYLLSLQYTLAQARRLSFILFLLLGNWLWANLAYQGAWQIALGFAVFGQLGALVSIMRWKNYLLAGFFFALAFGNRTEVILLTPIFFFLIYNLLKRDQKAPEVTSLLEPYVKFCSFPFILGVLTLLYNYHRFGAPFDFGYARIPGVLEEPWYLDGIFAFSAIPRNFETMILKGWRFKNEFPYLLPDGFGGSIFIASPYLLMIFSSKYRNRGIFVCSWLSIVALTLVLWLHGNTGGWQFSYRYACVLLPWIFLLLLETNPGDKTRISRLRAKSSYPLLLLSILINAWASYLFLRTSYL